MPEPGSPADIALGVLFVYAMVALAVFLLASIVCQITSPSDYGRGIAAKVALRAWVWPAVILLGLRAWVRWLKKEAS